VFKISLGFIFGGDPEPLRSLAVTEALNLGENEPYPVASLAALPQF
jgi:hypothetical protein